jgi:hypothetical protein
MINSFSGTGNNVAVSASTTSASGALPGTVGSQVRILNVSSAVAFFRTGSSAPTAVTTDAFVGPGLCELFSIPPDVTHVAVILSTGTGTVYFQRGSGI